MRTKLYIAIFCWFYSVLVLCTGCRSSSDTAVHRSDEIPGWISEYIDHIEYSALGGVAPVCRYESLTDEILRVTLSWDLKDTLRQDDWRLKITPAFTPGFYWTPHLAPEDDHIISQHVFRAPAIIMASEERQFGIIPDLELLEKGSPVEWYMDVDAQKDIVTLGMSRYDVPEHVLFTRTEGAVYPPGKVEYGFYILTEKVSGTVHNPWRKISSFLWAQWGKSLYAGQKDEMDEFLPVYTDRTYTWAFDTWRESVWQEFELGGRKVGAPVFIVNVTQSPNYPGKVNEREFRSVWNQAWFSSLRSAQGLYRYGRRQEDSSLMEKARMTKELALAFPQENGFFPAVIGTEMERITIGEERFKRSKGWQTARFGNSDRNPFTRRWEESPFHVLDMSFTAYLMLTWYEELEKDDRLLQYARRYADALLDIQMGSGFFPAWLSPDDRLPMGILDESSETSMSVTFLLKLYELTEEDRYRAAAIRAMDAVIREIIPEGRWEDFETYWSCSGYGASKLVNQKAERNDMYKQNNFSMYWTAEALLNTYLLTEDGRYLDWGRRTLDELLMTQAVWQPPFMYVNTLGGFGVLNADGEWNDSRQSLFAELILRYGKVLDNEEYIQRGLSALRASFVMMYCPENPRTKEQWEKTWPFFGEEDYGFMMENYGHNGVTNAEGLGIGEFTIYDWGNGAASEAYHRILDHFGEAFLSEH